MEASPSCAHKKAYHTRSYAKRVAKVARNNEHKKLRVYLCDECGMFHLTSVKHDKLAYHRRGEHGK